VIITICAAYASGPVAAAISTGQLRSQPSCRHTEAGSIEAGEISIDIALIAAPTADDYGNINGVSGPTAGSRLGEAMVDARHAKRIVAGTDNLVEYPGVSGCNCARLH
jgi:citrate lyase subunit alpha / citrate CoA-transferase